VRAFKAILKHLAGLSVDPDFMGHATPLNIKGIAQSAPAFFFFQLLVFDFPGKRFERDRAGVS